MWLFAEKPKPNSPFSQKPNQKKPASPPSLVRRVPQCGRLACVLLFHCASACRSTKFAVTFDPFRNLHVQKTQPQPGAGNPCAGAARGSDALGGATGRVRSRASCSAGTPRSGAASRACSRAGVTSTGPSTARGSGARGGAAGRARSRASGIAGCPSTGAAGGSGAVNAAASRASSQVRRCLHRPIKEPQLQGGGQAVVRVRPGAVAVGAVAEVGAGVGPEAELVEGGGGGGVVHRLCLLSLCQRGPGTFLQTLPSTCRAPQRCHARRWFRESGRVCTRWVGP